MVVDTT
jgi:hypothetical protein